MTNKAPFCAFLWLTITALSRLIITVYPKGLHNFAFFFQSLTPRPSSLIPVQPLISLSSSTYVPLRHLYICRESSTDIESSLQISPFLTNKANLRKSQMNVSDFITKDYGKMDTWSSGKNKPNTNPIQSQYKPKTNPIQSQFYNPACDTRGFAGNLFSPKNEPSGPILRLRG